MATKLGVYSARSVGANTTHCVTDCQEVTSGKGTRYKNGKRILVRSTRFLNPIFVLLLSQFYAFSFFVSFYCFLLLTTAYNTFIQRVNFTHILSTKLLDGF